MTMYFMIISNDPHSKWVQMVKNVLTCSGEVRLSSVSDANHIDAQRYSLIIVDASCVDVNIVSFVHRLHGSHFEVPIIVVTNSPTWRHAREVLLAGAADYIQRTFDKKVLLAAFHEAMGSFLLNIPPLLENCDEKGEK